MLTLATAILSLSPLIADTPPPADGRLPALPFIWDQQRTIERQPNVRLWFRGDNLFRRGDNADVYFRTDEDAYVVIVRIDTDGRLDILSPAHPDDAQFARGGRTYHVPGYSRGSFHISDDPGMGYVFAIASWEPFDLHRVNLRHSGAYRYAGQRIHGDPFTAVQDLADDLLGDRYGYYAMDHVSYYVNRRYEYPRYLCYDCHGYRSYAHWDPYAYRCVNFRIVIYNDPYYYPYRYSRGSRVIYVRAPRQPRYEFKEASAGSRRDTYIDYRFRGDDVDRRRPGSPADDPNLPRRASASNPGATRPGDDVRASTGGGRRVLGSDTQVSPGPDGRLPRRAEDDSPESRGPRRGNDGTAGNGGDAPERGVGQPRREPEREATSRLDPMPGGDARTPRRGGESERSPERESSEPRRQPERSAEPRREPERRPEMRAVEPRREPERRPEARAAEPQRTPERRPEGRSAEPRREPERRAEPQRAPERRAEPRQAEPRSAPSRGSESRAQPSRRAPDRQATSRPSSGAAKAQGKSSCGRSSRPSTTRRKP